MAKNERQRLQNAARSQEAAASREKRKGEIEKTMAATRVSTASMGRFDRKLEGEKKLRGVKRKVRLCSVFKLLFFFSFFSSFRLVCEERGLGVDRFDLVV